MIEPYPPVIQHSPQQQQQENTPRPPFTPKPLLNGEPDRLGNGLERKWRRMEVGARPHKSYG